MKKNKPRRMEGKSWLVLALRWTLLMLNPMDLGSGWNRPQVGDLPAVATGWCFSTTEIRSFLTAQ